MKLIENPAQTDFLGMKFCIKILPALLSVTPVHVNSVSEDGYVNHTTQERTHICVLGCLMNHAKIPLGHFPAPGATWWKAGTNCEFPRIIRGLGFFQLTDLSVSCPFLSSKTTSSSDVKSPEEEPEIWGLMYHSKFTQNKSFTFSMNISNLISPPLFWNQQL